MASNKSSKKQHKVEVLVLLALVGRWLREADDVCEDVPRGKAKENEDER